MRVLLVDDDLDRGRSLISYLIANGLTTENSCTHVGCVDSAKQTLRASYFDILILDVVLPKRAGEKPNSRHGLELLGHLSRSGQFHKPEKIIGISAHSSDLGAFRPKFEELCFSIIEATAQSDAWKATMCTTLKYTASSKLARSALLGKLCVVSVHGIRTFGGWQTRLEKLIKENIPKVNFFAYKYGVFSIFAFLLPFLRYLEVRRLANRLEFLVNKHPDSTFILFSHSFGTYLVAKALQKLVKKGIPIKLGTLILAASVLPRRFDWEFLEHMNDVRVVNDCGDRDYVLYLSEALIWGTGMAGKSGFNGFQSNRFRNRFFNGGHALYFTDNEFMKKNWLPLLANDGPIVEIDHRNQSMLRHEIFDKLICVAGACKIAMYVTLLGGLGLWLYR